MDSIVAYTEEIDDLEEAAAELFSQLEGFRFRKNSLAILYAEEDTDYPALYELLSQKWDFPVIGCTSMAMLLGEQGYCGIGISLMILSADDCSFSVGMTGELNKENYRAEIARVVGELRAQLDSEVKLALSFGGMASDASRVSGDELVDAINQAGDRKFPIYGGAASDGFSFTGYHVFCNGGVTKNGQAIALISGSVEPKAVCLSSVEDRVTFSYEVTKSEGNVVYRLGNGTFVEALQKEGMEADKSEVMLDYITSPFMVTVMREDHDSVEVGRTLASLDQKTGAGTFLGMIPEKSNLSIGVINRENVQKTVEQAFERILQEIEKTGGRQHTLLCTSCVARFLAQAGNMSAEAGAYLGRLPAGTSLLGFYGYGEYCPVQGSRTGSWYNMFHNFTFTILAI
jgi:hypothetical protein